MLLATGFIAINITLWLQALALWAGAIIAVFTVTTLLYKSPLGKAMRWFGRRVFSEPLTDTFDKKIAEAVQKAVEPSLTQLKQDAARLEQKNDDQHGENKRAIQRLDGGLEGIKFLIENNLKATRDAEENTRKQFDRVEDQFMQNRSLMIQHFKEAHRRDSRIEQLEREARDERRAIAESLERDRQASAEGQGPIARVDTNGV